jgi:hypothetical protein
MALGPLSDFENDFLNDYTERQGYWSQLAKTTHKICQRGLDIQGIRANTSFRGKSSESLAEKLKRFSVRRDGYKCFTDEFDLATFLFTWISRNPDKRDVHIGPVEALLKLLKIYKLDDPGHLKVELNKMHFHREHHPQVESTKAKFQPFELGISIYIMDHILSTKEESASAAKEARENYGEYGYKIRVMMSTIMWLDEFFLPVLKWEEKFSNYGKNQDQGESLKWFVSTYRLMKILRDGASPCQDEEVMLNTLWEWFGRHGEEVVRFVLKLAKMGVLKELPHEYHQFKRVCSSVKYLL